MKKLRLLIPLILAVMLFTGCSGSSEFDDELAELCQEMEEELMSAGIAYLGSVEKEEADEYMKNTVPLLCKDIPFTSKIPEAQTVGEGGDLFCIVTNDKKASVSVNRTDEFGKETEEIYKGKGDIPLLVFSNPTEFTSDTKVVVTQSDGTIVEFMLELDGYGRFWMTSTTNDFSPYDEILKYRYNKLIEEGYTVPTAEELTGSAWGADLLFLHDITQTYSLEFSQDKATLKWNSGFDESDKGMIVPWFFDQKDGVGVMKLFLGEHGERDYAVLLNKEKNKLYIAGDFTSGQTKRYAERLETELAKK